MVLEKRIDEIRKEDVEMLVQNGQRESQWLDYKEGLSSKEEKLDDLTRHVAGMANTGGGTILLGIAEKRNDRNEQTGEPDRICGLGDVNADKECLRIENMLKDNIRPRIVPAPRVRAIETGGGSVIVIRVERSLLKPHMTKQRFYCRQGSQTVSMEVEQVRSAFVESETLPQRLKAFRAERLADIIGGEARELLIEPATMVVHICPIAAFLEARRVDVVAIKNMRIPPPGKSGGYTYRLMFSGSISLSGNPGESMAYLHVSREGCVEFATTDVIDPPNEKRKVPLFRSRQVAELIVKGLPRVVDLLGQEVVSFPCAFMVSFLGAKGAYAMRDRDGHFWTESVMERNPLIPECMLMEAPKNWGTALREVLDSIWQGLGEERCPYYDSNGNFKME